MLATKRVPQRGRPQVHRALRPGGAGDADRHQVRRAHRQSDHVGVGEQVGADFAAVVQVVPQRFNAGGAVSRQSQLSRQLKELEEFFGAELIRRGRGQFTLTPAGRRLLALTQQHFSALEEFRSQCADEPVELRIGAGESLIQWVLLPLLPAFDHAVTGSTWTFLNLRSSDVIERLRDGRADLGLVRASAVPKGLRALPVGELALALFVPRQLGQVTPPGDLELLRGLPLALPETDDDSTLALRRAGRTVGIELQVRLRCTTFPQAAKAVRLGHAAAVLPVIAREDLIPPATQLVLLRCLKDCTHKLSIVWNPQVSGTRPMVEAAARGIAKAVKIRLGV